MAFIPLYNIAKFKNDKDLPKIGKVVYNLDPLKQGRIKVSITGIFDPIDEEGSNLPWVYKMEDTSFGGSTQREFFNVPSVGELVEVEWKYDNKNPFYKGCPYTKQSVTGVFQDDNYPKIWGWVDGEFAFLVNKEDNQYTIRTKDCSIVGTNQGIINIYTKTETNITSDKDINIKTKEHLTIEAETIDIKCENITTESTNNTIKSTNLETDTSNTNIHSTDTLNILGDGDITTIDEVNYIAHTHPYVGKGDNSSEQITDGVVK